VIHADGKGLPRCAHNSSDSPLFSNKSGPGFLGGPHHKSTVIFPDGTDHEKDFPEREDNTDVVRTMEDLVEGEAGGPGAYLVRPSVVLFGIKLTFAAESAHSCTSRAILVHRTSENSGK